MIPIPFALRLRIRSKSEFESSRPRELVGSSMMMILDSR